MFFLNALTIKCVTTGAIEFNGITCNQIWLDPISQRASPSEISSGLARMITKVLPAPSTEMVLLHCSVC